MKVVSDTSVLNYLILIGQAGVLPLLSMSVQIPGEVLRELTDARTPDAVRTWMATPPPWLTVEDPVSPIPALRLDAGESAAIALAMETKAEFLLIDERAGTMIARRLGLKTTGTLGILQAAARLGLVDIRAALTALRNQTSIWLTQSLMDAIIRDSSPTK
jgi:predicted nucleic acid-binding protein